MSALDLVARGYAVFPCRDDKAPATPRGFKDAARTRGAAEALFRQYPGPLIGVVTGAVSGIDILDVDLAKPSMAAWDWWASYCAYVPPTLVYQTRSGGLHVGFRHAAGVRNSASRIAQDVDVRGDGGYAIHWPSAGCAVLDASPLADWPEWLLDAQKLPEPPPAPPLPRLVLEGDAARRYAIGALRKVAERVATVAEGQRKGTLNAETFGLDRFIDSGELHASENAIALSVAASHAGLTAREAERALASALGMRGAHG